MFLTTNSAISFAKDLTLKAMEHSMISVSSDPVKTAKNVTDFFNFVADTLDGESNAKDN